MTDPLKLKFDEIIYLNEEKLDKKYIQSLTKQQRLDLVEPVFNILRASGWVYPDDLNKVKKSWNALLAYQPDLMADDLFNNSSLATDICKYFCNNFFLATEKGKSTLIDNFNDDKILKRIIENRLGLDWLDADKNGPGVNEAFNLSFKMIACQGQRSMRLVNATSMFKPTVSKFMALKYSNENDTIFDYSCGFGGRLLGTMAANRKYIGTDPLTTEELENMATFLQFKKDRYALIKSGSENYRGDENSVDLSYSSPPYLAQEVYSSDITQAYNQGDDYFYNTYWKQTLANVKYMLKPGKIFGFNILAKYTKMIEMAKEQFGEPIETVKLRTVRSHLSKGPTQTDQKNEPIYIFKNNK